MAKLPTVLEQVAPVVQLWLVASSGQQQEYNHFLEQVAPAV